MILSHPIADSDVVQDGHVEKRRILIIDDDNDQAEVLALGLSKQGFQPLLASTVTTGMMVAQLHEPDLILLDIRLPDGSGLELCEWLADSPDTSDVPIILVSGIGNDEILRQARAAGSTYFVRKPYDPNVLLTLVDDALSKANS